MTQTNKNSKNYSRALALAIDYAAPHNIARRRDIAEDIDGLVGSWVLVGSRHVLSWPLEIALATGEIHRHLDADVRS